LYQVYQIKTKFDNLPPRFYKLSLHRLPMQKEIMDFMKKHMDLLLDQTKSYQPFIKNAFPGVNPADACFNVIVGNAFSVFLSQYAMRLISPTEQDFADFGNLASQYKEKIDALFAK